MTSVLEKLLCLMVPDDPHSRDVHGGAAAMAVAARQRQTF
jgi:hypothetical protein